MSLLLIVPRMSNETHARRLVTTFLTFQQPARERARYPEDEFANEYAVRLLTDGNHRELAESFDEEQGRGCAAKRNFVVGRRCVSTAQFENCKSMIIVGTVYSRVEREDSRQEIVLL